jgi:hypothetical protein
MRKSLFHLIISLLAVTIGSKLEAQSISWESAIERVEASAEEYREYAVRVGGTSWAGSMYNGYQYELHRCAILGRMLGRTEIIQEIERLEYPPLNTLSEPHDLLVFSISLESWVAAARWASSAEIHQRINTWNLDCVGQYNIPRSMYIESPREEADFARDGTQLLVYGSIDLGFYDRFLEVLNSHPGIEEIVLGSGGGSVRDAILSGIEIRRRGLNTTIFGNCLSACPLVFMGGTQRVIWAGPYRLGFHQISRRNGAAVSADDPAYLLTANYLNQMGIDQSTVIRWMLSATPHEMYEPDVRTLCAPRVATFVQRVCNAN